MESSARRMQRGVPIGSGLCFQKTGYKWHLILKGDVGGFGVGADLTWSLQGGAVWAFAETKTGVL